jgi:Ca-activated chloride channel family protein
MVAAAILTAATTALADGLIVIQEPPPIPRHHGQPPYGFAPLQVKYHHVTVTIRDQVAVTEVDQSFFNPNGQRLEGTYLFPLPDGAGIDRFSMDVNGRMVEAELLDADKAQHIYEDIVRRMRDPALLEYAGQGLLKARIYPIEPRSEKRVTLSYTQILRRDAGMVEYLYPLNTEKFSSQPLESVSVTVKLTSSRGIRSVFSPSHEVEISHTDAGRAVIGYEAAGVRPDTDFRLFYSSEASDDVGLDLLTHANGREDGYFMLLASPSPFMSDEKIATKDVVFVLDTSGSMAERNKLDQARRALRFCLANLNPGDRFELIRFSTESELLFGELVAAEERNIERAEVFIDELRPIGGTAIEEALTRAIELAPAGAGTDRPFLVVFLTDGKPTVGASDVEGILDAVANALDDRPIRVFCFGIGTDINTRLLDTITERTRSVSQYVLPDEDIEIKVSNFYSKISHPVLANPELEFERGLRLTMMHPMALPDLFRGEQLLVLGRYRGSGHQEVTLTGTVNGSTRRFAFEGEFARRNDDNDFIARLWATRRVGYLLDQIRLHGDSRELREEVTELARRYAIVTPYTAHLIVEDENARAVPAVDRTLQVIGSDPEVRQIAQRIWREVNEAEAGDAAVGGAQAYDTLKRARKMAAPAEANIHVQRGQTGLRAESGNKIDQALHAQRARLIAGKTFYLNGGQWVDAELQAHRLARRVVVEFNSPEYFDLLRQSPAAAQWLSLGRNVLVLVDGTAVEVTDRSLEEK